MEDRSEELSETFKPQQMGVGVKSGMQKSYASIDIHCSHPQHRHHVVGTIDIKNAYQETERAGMLRAIKAHPQWRQIYKTIWATMSPACIIKHVNQVLSDNGCIQGDPPATATFCMAIHSDVVWADTYLKARGGFAIFFADDGYFVGPASDVYHVMNEFRRRIRARLNLHYSETKEV